MVPLYELPPRGAKKEHSLLASMAKRVRSRTHAQWFLPTEGDAFSIQDQPDRSARELMNFWESQWQDCEETASYRTGQERFLLGIQSSLQDLRFGVTLASIRKGLRCKKSVPGPDGIPLSVLATCKGLYSHILQAAHTRLRTPVPLFSIVYSS